MLLNSITTRSLALLGVLIGLQFHALAAHATEPFTAIDPAQDKAAKIVVQYDAAANTGINWTPQLAAFTVTQMSGYTAYRPELRALWMAVHYLQEGIQRMTGKKLEIQSSTDLSSGIVFTLLDNAPADIKALAAPHLASDGSDSYNNREAYYLHSEAERTLIVANTYDGLLHGAVDLLAGDSAAPGFEIGYEQLGMGPNWTYTPDYSKKPLRFNVDADARPGFYNRDFSHPSGIGLIRGQNLQAPDELEAESYYRWRAGAHFMGHSMPAFPGEAMETFHRGIVMKMVSLYKGEGKPEQMAGFLAPTWVGPDASRPAPSAENNGTYYIDTDKPVVRGNPSAFVSDGKQWKQVQPELYALGAYVDLSAPITQQVILDAMKERMNAQFAAYPDDLAVFGTEIEDGGLPDAVFATRISNPDWWPQYREANGLKPQPYVLNNFFGPKDPNQPLETWWHSQQPADLDNAQTDTAFAFNNWLLREYDKYLDSLPAGRDVFDAKGVLVTPGQLTKTGQSKRRNTRTSLYSYGYHDVPPNFNLDPRIRVMVASFPVHRGKGKWIKTYGRGIFDAWNKMLPAEPTGCYWILSNAYYTDSNLSRLSGSPDAATIAATDQSLISMHIRSIVAETDLNFGKDGLLYYLHSKMLWNPKLTAEQLEAVRTRWLQRAFGKGWPAMKEYYDGMAPGNTFSGPVHWANMMNCIDRAEAAVGDSDPAVTRRLDDLKQFWYFYYLTDIDRKVPENEAAFREFAWKGQMSYMTDMNMVMRVYFKQYDPKVVAGDSIAAGPAHYTHAETQAWWAKVKAHWPLYTGGYQAPAGYDVNDLVSVQEFGSAPAPSPSPFHGYAVPVSRVLTVAKQPGDTIGLVYFWSLGKNLQNPILPSANYGIDYWNAKDKTWRSLVALASTTQQAELAVRPNGIDLAVIRVAYTAPAAGTYRVSVGPGGDLANIASLDYDAVTNHYPSTRAFTYSQGINDTYLFGGLHWFYIPKSATSLDLEIGQKFGMFQTHINFYGDLTGKSKPKRAVTLTGAGLKKIPLEPGEAGALAAAYCTGGASGAWGMPNLYSIPNLWANAPGQLLVPRAVAQADGLTTIGP
jgi:hypothetical protein